MYWIDTFAEGFAVWFECDMVELCETREEAEALIEKLRGE